MGVKISDIVTKEETSAEALAGKTLAMDAFNTLYQFLTIIRQQDGTPLMDFSGNVTSHLSGIFYRSINLMQHNIKLVYVFDGPRPQFKSATVNSRVAAKQIAEKKREEALESGDEAEAKKQAQMATKLTSEMIDEAKELLRALGIPIIQAPSEGEAQAAYLAKNRDAYASVSQDMDSMLFGAPRLVRNLNITGKRKIPGTTIYREIKPEMIFLDKTLADLKITHDQLIILGILVGTDYNPGGILGIGQKKALKLVLEHKELDKVLEKVEWNYDLDPRDIFDFFKSPPVLHNYSLDAPAFDREKVLEIMVQKHNFSRERMESMFAKLDEAAKKRKQTTLGGWGK
ncbi:MAG: flap endonuclease-1 [Nanoarchaeota archaeon]|nr:flap endonuclease-1 [Nanoarchaeota archaeon]MBU4299630.1 flap endonuclease-1 [Nanoarchaeota archaeon]MBU4452620.1 flap endonuclease-1 [Nanoarchaeota archaeon]MCG2723913.1 flap endonuclease-1 [archaeon]